MGKKKSPSKKSVSKASTSQPSAPVQKRKSLKDWFKDNWNFMVVDAFKGSFGAAKSKLSILDGNHPIYRLLFSALLVVILVGLPVLSFDYGITWDEPEDRAYFKEVLAYFQTFGEDKRCLDTDLKLHEHLVNYGPFVNLIQAVANEYFSPFDIYETRHLIITIFAFIGLLFTGLVGKRLGNWQVGFLALLFMFLTPTIFGHGMNNQKDIPFLAFYIASFYYLLRYLSEGPKPSLYTSVMLGVTMGILMSIRVGGLLMFAYAGLFAGIQFLLHIRQKKTSWSIKNIWTYLRPLLSVYVLGYIIGIIFWPAALQDPFNHPFAALTNFEKFGFVHIWEIFEGDRYYIKEFPWHYLPKSMLITIPLFALSGLVVYVATLFIGKRYKSVHWFEGLVTFILIFPLAYIIYKQSAVYSSWRHVLFLYPSIVILAALGWSRLTSLITKSAMKFIPIGLVAINLLMVGFWMIKNHPYQYMYYNEIVGGTSGALGKYELDYWCQTPKHAIIDLLENEGLAKNKGTVASNNDYNTMQYYADKLQENGRELYEAKLGLEKARDQREQLRHYKKEGILSSRDFEKALEPVQKDINDYGEIVSKLRNVKISWRRDREWNKSEYDYAIWTTRTLDHAQLTNGYWPPKGTMRTIDVGGAPVAAIVKSENKDLIQGNHLSKKREFDNAAKLFKAYQAFDPLEEEAFRNYGLVRVQQGRNEEAIRDLWKSIELSPSNYQSYNFLGYAYAQSRQIDSAKYCFKKCIELKVNMSGAHEGLGRLYLAEGKLQLAQQRFEDAIAYGNRTPLVFYNMGECLYRLGDSNKALNYYGQSIQIDKNFKQGYLRVAQILEALGDTKQAQQYYQKAQQLP